MSKAQSFWVATGPTTDFPPLAGDTTVDAAIIGGGIAGLTAAALLSQAGFSVAVIEARRIGGQATGHSTAKVTAQHALIYAELRKSHGADGARAYAEANQAAVERVAGFVRDLAIDCDFERRPAYVFTRDPGKVSLLEGEADVARGLGLPAELVRNGGVGLPFEVTAALRFRDQAQFHPTKYLAGLAHGMASGGCHVFENTRATDVEHGTPCRVITERGTVTARDVIVATHLPVVPDGMFFAKAYPHTLPALAAAIEPAHAPDGMFLSMDTPSLSVIRAMDRGRTYLIAAGGRYKTGHTGEATDAMAALERSVRETFSVGDIAYRWTNQDYTPMDRIPFVGQAGSGKDHLFVATGFQAWGLSNGTVAGMILADTITGRPNSWAKLFDATRLDPGKSAPTFLKENMEVAGHLVGGYLARRPLSPEQLAPGEAGVFEVDGARIAAHRDDSGTLREVSAICTHLKCIVGWNPTDGTWDCPCHGSRFTVAGDVIHGPAVQSLPARKPG